MEKCMDEKEITLELTFVGLTLEQVEELRELVESVAVMLGGKAAGGYGEVQDDEAE